MGPRASTASAAGAKGRAAGTRAAAAEGREARTAGHAAKEWAVRYEPRSADAILGRHSFQGEELLAPILELPTSSCPLRLTACTRLRLLNAPNSRLHF